MGSVVSHIRLPSPSGEYSPLPSAMVQSVEAFSLSSPSVTQEPWLRATDSGPIGYLVEHQAKHYAKYSLAYL